MASNICRYVATRRAAGLYDLRFTVLPEHAIDLLDAGTIEIFAISKERCEFEHDAMQALGYEMVSEMREIISNIC